MTELDELMAVPEEHRRTIARWLLDRSERYQPSMVLSEDAAELVRGAVLGCAVDLADPESEDSTVEHANEVILGLVQDTEIITIYDKTDQPLATDYAVGAACTSQRTDPTGSPWKCTRVNGHDGRHEAGGSHGRVYASWPLTTSPE